MKIKTALLALIFIVLLSLAMAQSINVSASDEYKIYMPLVNNQKPFLQWPTKEDWQ